MKISEMESTKSFQETERGIEWYFSCLVSEIHTVIAATADDDGMPVTCAMDIMDSDACGLYFLTARGKGFYHRLRKRQFIALTGVYGKDTMSSFSISVRGHVEETGPDILNHLIERNRYMYEIYPTEESRKALVAFRIYEGTGEYFDLSSHPINRRGFSFGYTENTEERLFITEKCTGCGLCLSACPQHCIDSSSIPFRVKNENCLMCGICSEICPEKAVLRRRIHDTR